ncbi:MAG TPA: sigma-70 family RNA polymerase sigma factor [Acidimicrobiales bacterium]
MHAGADADLVALARDGDVAAWRELVARHVGLVHAICRGQPLDAAVAADVHQLVWLRLAENLDRIRSPEAIGGWIAATARNECARVERRGPRNGGCPDGSDGDGAPAAAEIDLGLLVYERDRVLMAAFARLDDHSRRLLRLLMADPGPAATEVGAALDLPVASIGPARARALDQLRRLVTEASPAFPALPPALPTDDDALDGELRRLVALADPVPATWCDMAEAGMGWLAIEAEPALLAYDSAARRDAPGGPPVGSALREMRFTAGGDRAIEVELDVGRDRLRVLGRVQPARAGEVVAGWPEGCHIALPDDRGEFHVDDLPRRPLCIHVAGDDPVKTGWIVP